MSDDRRMGYAPAAAEDFGAYHADDPYIGECLYGPPLRLIEEWHRAHDGRMAAKRKQAAAHVLRVVPDHRMTRGDLLELGYKRLSPLAVWDNGNRRHFDEFDLSIAKVREAIATDLAASKRGTSAGGAMP
jgi:hypothetical protein